MRGGPGGGRGCGGREGSGMRGGPGRGPASPPTPYRSVQQRSVRSHAVYAVTAARIDRDDPLAGLEVGERPEPDRPRRVDHRRRAGPPSLNHHDLWSLRGVGLARGPAADDPRLRRRRRRRGRQRGRRPRRRRRPADWRGDETLDPKRSLLSERHPGTFAERVAVPRRNLVPKPAELTFEEAACLPTAWLTAYRMLFTRARRARPARPCSSRARAAAWRPRRSRWRTPPGIRVCVTSRVARPSAPARCELGADAAFEPGARLPERVDAVMETVGEATWSHSLQVAAARRHARRQRRDQRRRTRRPTSTASSSCSCRSSARRWAPATSSTPGPAARPHRRARPLIDDVRPLADARRAFERMVAGDSSASSSSRSDGAGYAADVVGAQS